MTVPDTRQKFGACHVDACLPCFSAASNERVDPEIEQLSAFFMSSPILVFVSARQSAIDTFRDVGVVALA